MNNINGRNLAQQNPIQGQNKGIVKLFSEEELKKLSLEERLGYINKLLDNLEDPNIIEQYFMGKKKEASAIQEMKVVAIQSRRDVIESLGNSLKITVKQEEGLLGTTFAANLIGTTEKIALKLNGLNEQAIDLLVDDFLGSINNINSRVDPPKHVRQQQLENAEQRLVYRQTDTLEGFQKLLSEFRGLVHAFVTSIHKA
jgi:hypothetical protein